MLPLNAPAVTIHVTSKGDDDNSGTLRNAVTSAASGDTIDASGISGIITLTNGELLVTNSITIIGPGPANLAVNGSGSSPVFMIRTDGSATISGLTITHFSFPGVNPSYVGRGIYNDHSVLTISNCTVSGNSDSEGGGLYNDGYDGSATLTIYYSTVSSNSADYGAGIYNDSRLSDSTTITIYASTVSGNEALDGNGGGILNTGHYGSGLGGQIEIQNSTFSGNTAAFSGGGIFNDGEQGSTYLEIQNSTFCSNSATYYGGAILNEGDTGGSAIVEVGNTILSEDLSGGTIVNVGDMIYNGAFVISLGYNLSTDDANGYLTGPGDQINTDPLLGPLADNGGLTKTHFLLTGSPAIDAGDPAFTPPPDFDQRGPGFQRIVNGRIDIGAVESSMVPPYISIQPTNETVTVAKTATLSVSASSTTPLTYQWFKNSAKLAASSRISGVTAHTLTISNAVTTDAGTYFVKVSNKYGVSTSSNAVLTVFVPDITPPMNTITSPRANQRWSNEVFNVTGTATDNVAVSNVLYSLNNVGWSNALTANGWTNWTAAVTLTPGTNTLQAYAMDTAGNISVTNSLSFDYVVTNQLGVRAIGIGILSPNYSNAWLEIGRNYSMTATPASGFVFTNWIASINWLGGVMTNKVTVQFMMQSNLTLQVTFVDVTRPTLTITAPTNLQKMTNALADVKGTASDNWGVNNVWYQLNGGAWNLTITTNTWTNWSVTLPLVLGTNTVKAYAMDLGGNTSITNSVSMISSNNFMLQLGFTLAKPMATNGLNFSLQVSHGINGTIQVSSNLVNWLTLTNFVGTNSPLNFRDSAATNFSRRFYRAVAP